MNLLILCRKPCINGPIVVLVNQFLVTRLLRSAVTTMPCLQNLMLQHHANMPDSTCPVELVLDRWWTEPWPDCGSHPCIYLAYLPNFVHITHLLPPLCTYYLVLSIKNKRQGMPQQFVHSNCFTVLQQSLGVPGLHCWKGTGLQRCCLTLWESMEVQQLLQPQHR